MKRTDIIFFCVTFILTSPTVYGDFFGDRCYADARGGISPSISRLYIGKKNTNKCLGATIDQCVKHIGDFTEIDELPGGVTLFRFFGQKNLYLGTGTNHKSIGPEWREMRVIDGKITKETSFVQVLEHGYSWNARPFISIPNRSFSCEQFGKCGTLSCSLTPVEPIPELPEPPEVTKRYTAPEIYSHFFQLITLDACSSLSEEYENQTRSVRERWRKTAPALIDMLEASPEYSSYIKRVKSDKNRKLIKPTAQSMRHCDDVLTNFIEHLDGPDPRFSSPEKTWALFIESLKKGDKVTTSECLTGRAKQNLGSFFNESEAYQLKNMGNSFIQFELLEPMGKYQEAVTSRTNGSAGFVIFFENAGNWKISDM